MAQQSIKLTPITGHILTSIRYDIGTLKVTEYLSLAFAEAAYPDVHPDFLYVAFSQPDVQSCINRIYNRAISDAMTDRTEITDIQVGVSMTINPKTKRNAIFAATATLITKDPMEEAYATDALTRCIDIDAATLAVEREMAVFGKVCFNDSHAKVDIKPEVRAWHDLKQTNPDLFYEIAAAAYKHFGCKPWAKAWSEAHSEIENFQCWVMTHHPQVDAFTQLIGMNPDPAILSNEEGGKSNVVTQTAAPEPTANTNNQPPTPTPMAQTKTATTTIPAGYKVAPAADPTNPEAIASQFKTQFEKALSATSPSGAKLADCELVWSATTRPNDIPGRIISCKVIENEQTWHTFTFDCKDRHRDSTTYDEGMKFDWLSVDAMIKAFNGQASVLDCVKESCRKRLMGPAAAPAPKAATKTAADPQPQTAAPAPATVPEGSPEGQTPAIPKAQTKSAAPAAPQTAAPTAHPNTITPSHPNTPTPALFKTYENPATPSYFYHLYGDADVSGFLSIRKSDGAVIQHSRNQTTESSLAIIEKNGMTEVTPIPDVVITALIKEGVIKTPMAVAPQPQNAEPTEDNAAEQQAAAEAEAAAKAAEEQAQREREAQERAEQERKAAEAKAAAEKAKREAEERAKREAAEKDKREEEERERKAEEEAKRKAEEEAKRKAEEEAKRRATMLIRHRDYDKIKIEVELQPLTRTGNYFWGDAGTGKTHMAKQLADDLGLKFYYQGVVQMINDFKGLVDGHGRFHATAAYYAATKGGMLVLDEMDRYPEDALIWLNGLIANRYASFYVWDEELQCVSEQTITAHPDFRVVATGNTNGEGPTPLYTAAVQLDASTLDRFNFTHVDYDERVELSIAEGDAELVEFIEAFRATVRDCRFNNLVTYRAVETIHVYMKDGRISIKDAITDRIIKGMSTENQRFVATRLGDHVNTTRNKYAKAYCELANENYRNAASKVA